MANITCQGSISLVDNTASSQPPERVLTHTTSAPGLPSITRLFTKSSVKSELAKRKYAKWQRERLDMPDSAGLKRNSTRYSLTDNQSDSRSAVQDTEDSRERQNPNLELLNVVPTQTRSVDLDAKPASELDILYENQRGWFFFGIPFYSDRSLLQFDPSAWVTKDYNDSPVDITNAQVPDPSWEWAWQTWFVDMSDDVDEEGWQYSISFGMKWGWHGTHPWFHSWVRRRRWVRLRTKKKHMRGRARADETGWELAHRLNEDYFTIHSQNVMSREPSLLADPTISSPANNRQSVGTSLDGLVIEDIEDIPTLLQALKDAIIDRERVEILKKFLAQGGEELFYLAEQVPEILSLFVFQTSRWQFLNLIQDSIDQESSENTSPSKSDDKEIEARRRRRNNLSKTLDAINKEISGYEVFDITKEAQVGSGGSFKSSPGKARESSISEIRGIPKAANIGKEGHIY
ncbi:hypothetical protein BGW36DRAFT_461109 [Talaromyces proteolyticus]|uniref:Peroxin/Ferlin domain-containing protein n=1 Tax=Talaromyces proteolyticus TaxID=1131652 RepID=A0AAD4PVS1_9EURO|nr:uncharacterized protein BGW36DRAFT_461109 [Talaromyces proteolyticus]KAH8697065.1 hypothetical protein BGW36DRAFT_461109 [Talaromyces proteolyticus]